MEADSDDIYSPPLGIHFAGSHCHLSWPVNWKPKMKQNDIEYFTESVPVNLPPSIPPIKCSKSRDYILELCYWSKHLLGLTPAEIKEEWNYDEAVYQFSELENKTMVIIRLPPEEEVFREEDIKNESRVLGLEIDLLFTEILTDILAKVQESHSVKFKDATASVSPDSNDRRRLAVKTAVSRCGLNVIRLLNDPTAACLAYGLNQTFIDDKERFGIVVNYFRPKVVTLMIVEQGIFEIRAVEKLEKTKNVDDELVKTLKNYIETLTKQGVGLDDIAQLIKEKKRQQTWPKSTMINGFQLKSGKLAELELSAIQKSNQDALASFLTANMSSSTNSLEFIVISGEEMSLMDIENCLASYEGASLYSEKGACAISLGLARQAGILAGATEEVFWL